MDSSKEAKSVTCVPKRRLPSCAKARNTMANITKKLSTSFPHCNQSSISFALATRLLAYKIVRARTLLRVLVSWVIVLLKEMYLNILTIAKNTLRATKAFACVEETSFYSGPLYRDF